MARIEGDIAQARRRGRRRQEMGAAVVRAPQPAFVDQVDPLGVERGDRDVALEGAERQAGVGRRPVAAAVFAAQDAGEAGRGEEPSGFSGEAARLRK